MSLSAEVLDAVGAEVRGSSNYADITLEVDRWRRKYFATWCALRGLSTLPAEQQTVVRLIEEHWSVWSWAHMRGMATTIARDHRSANLPDPTVLAVRAVLRRAAREKGRVAEPLIDAMSMNELAAMVRHHRGTMGGESPRALWCATGLVIAARLGVRIAASESDLLGLLAGVRLTVRSADVVIAGGGRNVVIDPERQPVPFAVLTRAAESGVLDASTAPPPARGASLALAWRRAGWGAMPSCVTPAEWSNGDLLWLIENLDVDLAQRRRDVAYLLVGAMFALRHQDLAHLELVNLEARPEGFLITVLESKTDQESRRPPRSLPHVGGAAGECLHELCPACALANHLQVVAAQGRATGPVFATFYAGRWRAMTRQNGSLLIKAAWQAAGLDPSRRIGTRSLRATGATAAWEIGMPLPQIAETVTLHATLSEVQRYIRARRPAGIDLDL